MSQSQDFVRLTSPALNGADLEMFKKLRETASRDLSKLNIPSTKEEYWKYTRLNKLSKKNYSNSEQSQKVESQKAFTDHSFKIVDGKWENEILNTEKTKLIPISEASSLPEVSKHIGQQHRSSEHYFDALNTSSFNQGYILWVAEGHNAGEIDIQEFFTCQAKAYQQRYFVMLEKGAKLNLIHRMNSVAADQMINAMLETKVGESAHFSLQLIQDMNEKSALIDTIYCEQQQKSEFEIFTGSLDGELIRNNLNIDVLGEHCITRLNGLSLGKGTEHIDHHTTVDHKVPNCESHENYKGIFYDRSTGVFNGKVFVRQDAQKTNAFQSNQNIVMSDDAKVYSKPELEIYADDVKCSHGSTTGQFDDEAIFYLRSRGIGLDKARGMLVQAFLAELVEDIQNDALRTYLENRIEDKLSKSL
jgi:Fe-S cluster assembly protein SufD